MKLFVESSAILSERWGIGQFTKRLVEAYHHQYPEQPIRLFAFRLFYRRFLPPIAINRTLGYRLIRWFPGKIYTGLFKHGLPLPIDLLIGAGRKDVIIFPNFVRWPLLLNRRSMTFVHDLSFLFYGQYSSPPNRAYMLRHVPQSIRKSSHILTISESSKRDIVEHFKVPAKKVSVVYPFVDREVFNKRPSQEIATIRKKFKLPKQYILFVSSLEPRKNVIGLMEAYNNLDPKLQKNYGLVLAGGKGWLNEDIHTRADELVEKGLNIVRTGYVPDEDLPAMYSGASLFSFPSFYEGFGIPPLEAMACGIPVVTANNSSLPEVVGNAALLIKAEDTFGLAAAMAKVLTDSALRKALVSKGLEQAAKFNPGTSAKQLQQAIEKVL